MIFQMMERFRRLWTARERTALFTKTSDSWNGHLHNGTPVVFGADWGAGDYSAVTIITIKDGEMFFESVPVAQL